MPINAHILSTITTDFNNELTVNCFVFFSQNYDFSNNSSLNYLEFIVDKNLIDNFPECSSLFRLFLSLSVSTVSTERVKNSFKIIKGYWRETLTKYSIHNIEISMANIINLDITIEIFVEQKAGKFTIT